MNSPEVFYLHIQGEQRGPYTIRHIDHLLNCGLIDEDALFWREGLEQWQPVTNLVVRRQPINRWKKPLIALAIAAVLALPVYVFGPITVAGWREIYQHDYTKEAAYWRARYFVRNECVPQGWIVTFEPISPESIELTGHNGGVVVLRGTLTDARDSTRPTQWKVRLGYDAQAREWSRMEAKELAAR